MPRIFISYRRSDSITMAGRIYDSLANKVGEDAVFKDTEDILASKNWRKVLENEVHTCDVMLVIIGKNWLDAKDSSGQRRLDDRGDWVRFEVETALWRGIHVIPILLDGATMPREADLPKSLQSLTSRQALLLGEDPLFRKDMEELIKIIVELLKPSSPSGGKPMSSTFWEAMTVTVAGGVIVGLILLLFSQLLDSTSTPVNPTSLVPPVTHTSSVSTAVASTPAWTATPSPTQTHTPQAPNIDLAPVTIRDFNAFAERERNIPELEIRDDTLPARPEKRSDAQAYCRGLGGDLPS